MSKNTILNNAIGAVLAFPRQALWTTTVAVAAFSLEAGVSIIGDQFAFNVGTPVAQAAVEGSFTNLCNGSTIDSTFFGGPAVTATARNALNKTGTESCQTTIEGTPDILNVTSYALEVFQAGTPSTGVPSGDNDNHLVKYVWSGGGVGGAIGNKYAGKANKMTLSLPNGGTLDTVAVKVVGEDLAVPCLPANISGASPTFTLNNSVVGCTLADNSEIYVAFKLKGITASTLKDSQVKLDISFKDTSPFSPNPTRSVIVADLSPGLTVKVLPESGGFLYTSSATEDKEFISLDTTTDPDKNPYISQNEARIGFVQFVTNDGVANADAKTRFEPGKAGDTGTFTITNGQFAASKGDANGKAFLLAGGSEINADVVDPPVADTKTWTLTAAQLNTISKVIDDTGDITGLAEIRIRVDGATPVNPIDGDPVGTIEIKLGSLNPAPTIKTPDCATCTSPLLRIPSDGKTCWIHNIPDVGVLDAFSLRITNNHPTMPAKIIGTMYHEDGTSDDFTSVIVAEAIAPRATIRLGTEDLVKLGTSVTWKDSQFQGKERRIMKLVSTVPDIEVFNLIRGSKDGSQPMVNVSTGVRGFDCYPR